MRYVWTTDCRVVPHAWMAATMTVAVAAVAATSLLAADSPAAARAAAGIAAGASVQRVPVPPAVILDGVEAPPMALRERLLPYLNQRGASVRDWSADGRSLYITTRFANTYQLHRLDRPMGARRQITFFDEPVGFVRLSRDQGPPMALLERDEGGGENYQIHRLDLASGKLTLLTDGKSRNPTFELSRDGRCVAFTSNARNGKDMDVYTVDPRDPSTRRRLVDVSGDFSIQDFSPDGRRLLVLEEISINESYVHEIYVHSGAMRCLTPRIPGRKIAYQDPRYAPDGRGVLVTTDGAGEFRELALLEPGGRTRRLSAHIPWNVDAFALSPDGHTVAFVVNEGGFGTLHLLDLPGGSERPAPRIPAGLVSQLRFDPAGTRLAFTLASARVPSDVFTLDMATGAVDRWTESEVGGLDTATWVEPTLTDYPTFDAGQDGRPRRIPLFYFRPPDRVPGERHGVILTIHGGPESQWRPGFNPSAACYVNELGLAVLAPNVRGSDGYGKGYLLLDNGLQREDSIKDIGALLDWIRTRPELDPGRVVVMGGSYGGFMVLAALDHYADRIRAGIDVVGISNLVTFLEHTSAYRRDLRREEYGDEREPAMRAFLESISPLNHVDRMRSPLLCLQGANDPRVPAQEAASIVKALRARGVDAWFVLARNEGHGFNKRENQDLAAELMFAFLQKVLGSRRIASSGE